MNAHITVSGHHAYVTDQDAVLHLIDVEDPEDPGQVGEFDLNGGRLATIAGDLAYVTRYWDFDVVNLSDPANPVTVGSYDASGTAPAPELNDNSHFADIALSGSHACFVSEFFGLDVVDVSQPELPARVSRYNTAGSAWSIALTSTLNGQIAVVSGGESGFEVMDISQPDQPEPVGIDTVRGRIEAIANGYAYVIGEPIPPSTLGSLTVVDVSNPSRPRPVSRGTGFGASHAFVGPDHIFVAAGEDGLIILKKPVWLRWGPSSVENNGDIRFYLTGESGRSVRVQRSVDTVIWDDWKTVILTEEGCEIIDTANAASRCFYRAVHEDSSSLD